MSEAKQGDEVKVHFTGKLTDGTIFDKTDAKQPLQFKIGNGALIPGFETAVVGMKPGDSKTIELSADDAFGPRRDELELTVPRTELPEGLDPKLGERLELSHADGECEGECNCEDEKTFVVTVTGTTEEEITLDANHPLAGKDVIFEITLDSIA